jgi:hypothetical protein
MIAPQVRERIGEKLERIEKTENIRALYACESGSRAWGFESEDSDYDVRFTYVHPTECYLSIQNKTDVIERPIEDELDFSGWDLDKTLELFRKSNPPLLEWLQSPIVYRQTGSVVSRLRKLLPDYYSPKSCMYHYLNMARNNWKRYLQGEEIWVKKYFYVLRPVLACRWIEADRGPVPMEFEKLLDAVVEDPGLRQAIDALLKDKREGKELRRGKPRPKISDFLEREIDRLSAEHRPPSKTADPTRLDRVFRELLIEVNGGDIEPDVPSGTET